MTPLLRSFPSIAALIGFFILAACSNGGEEIRSGRKAASSGPAKNLIANPVFETGPGGHGTVRFWYHGTPAQNAAGSSFGVYNTGRNSEIPAIGIGAGRDGQAFWATSLPACESGATYRFTAEAFKHNVSNSVYAEMEIWGQRFRMNTVVDLDRFHAVRQEICCPDVQENGKKSEFRFIHPSTEGAVYLRQPRLIKYRETVKEFLPNQNAAVDFFPIGVYGANADNIADIAAMGFNSAIIAPKAGLLEQCRRLGLRCMVDIPRAPGPLSRLLEQSGTLFAGASFYVNDEPGIHSYPIAEADEINRILKKRYPDAVTAMAVVRPQVIPWYDEAADFFMLDQYPVPNMPLAWLTDSIDEAAEYVGHARLMAVIQAFGDDAHASCGWPRLPTFEELHCLSFLALIHDVRGLYFFIFGDMTALAEGREALSRVTERLNRLASWLKVINSKEQVVVKMFSIYGTGNRGEAAVHCAYKDARDGRERGRLLLCANSTATYVQADISVAAHANAWRDWESDEVYVPGTRGLSLNFAPFEVRIFMRPETGIATQVQ